MPPLNLVGDFGGGGMLPGVRRGLRRSSKRRESGKGQVVDAAMVDGAAVADDDVLGLRAVGMVDETSAARTCSTPARHCYDVYERPTASTSRSARSSRSSTPSCCERPRPRRRSSARPDGQRTGWPVLKGRFDEMFSRKTRDEWCAIMERTDVCFAPVLTMSEAAAAIRTTRPASTFVEIDGVVQPAPAPRFSRTKPEIRQPAGSVDQHADEALYDWGFSADEVAELRACGAIG